MYMLANCKNLLSLNSSNRSKAKKLVDQKWLERPNKGSPGLKRKFKTFERWNRRLPPQFPAIFGLFIKKILSLSLQYPKVFTLLPSFVLDSFYSSLPSGIYGGHDYLPFVWDKWHSLPDEVKIFGIEITESGSVFCFHMKLIHFKTLSLLERRRWLVWLACSLISHWMEEEISFWKLSGLIPTSGGKSLQICEFFLFLFFYCILFLW